MPMRIGICTSSGRQPASGLTPASRNSSPVFCWSICGLFLYFSWIFFIFGWMSCIAFIDLTCFTVSG